PSGRQPTCAGSVPVRRCATVPDVLLGTLACLRFRTVRRDVTTGRAGDWTHRKDEGQRAATRVRSGLTVTAAACTHPGARQSDQHTHRGAARREEACRAPSLPVRGSTGRCGRPASAREVVTAYAFKSGAVA